MLFEVVLEGCDFVGARFGIVHNGRLEAFVAHLQSKRRRHIAKHGLGGGDRNTRILGADLFNLPVDAIERAHESLKPGGVIRCMRGIAPAEGAFASAHGKKPFEMIRVAYGDQVMWPDHCVQNTEDAQIAKGINIPQANLIIRKGFRKDVDGYSAFLEADKKTHSGLASYFKERGIDTVFIAGLATDFCVAWTVVDSCHAGFTTYVVEDACRAIDVNGSLAKAWADMTAAGVKRIQSSNLDV